MISLLALAGVGTAEANPWHPRVDVEPAAFALRGFSVHVGVEPPATPRWLFSAGAYAFDVPSLLVDLAPGNRDEGWEARLVLGYGVFAERFVGRGWLVGGQLGVQHYRASDADGTEASFASVILLARAGYEWHPRGAGGYLFPWVGAALTTTIAGDPATYDVLPVIPYAAIDLGWRF